MCIHRLFIYTVCGHSMLAAKPTVICVNASIPPKGTASTTCELIAHPYQSWRLNRLCDACACTRSRLLQRIDDEQAITYDEVKWKVSYGMPTHGLDLWGKRAAEREKLEEETGKRKRRSMRFSWRKHGRRKSKGAESNSADDFAIAGKIRNARLDLHWLQDSAGTATAPSHTTPPTPATTH